MPSVDGEDDEREESATKRVRREVALGSEPSASAASSASSSPGPGTTASPGAQDDDQEMDDESGAASKRRKLAMLMQLEEDSYEFRKYEEWAFELGEGLPGLTPELVRDAKEKELESMRNMDVFDIIPISEADKESGGIWVDSRWVVSNKGSESDPIAKARLVAREFADQKRHDLYAGTPGLGFIKMCLAVATRYQASSMPVKKVMTLDVKTAFLYGKARRKIFVTLPRDIAEKYEVPVVGRLKRALYGTRDALAIWGEHLKSTLEKIGCKASTLMPGVFNNSTRDLLIVAHVDDLICVAEDKHLQWLKAELEKHYTLKAKVTGPEKYDEKTTVFLGRSITWTPEGIAWEADLKHIAGLLAEHNLEQCNAVSTPITASIYADKKPGDRDRRPDMPKEQATAHRRACATINYVGQDRPDLAVTACELSKSMARPKVGDGALVKRCLRYLRGRRRAV